MLSFLCMAQYSAPRRRRQVGNGNALVTIDGRSPIFPSNRACYRQTVKFSRLTCSALLLIAASSVGRGDATVDGVVALPKTRTAPVAVNRYEIVSNHGILATSPPLAVVYLDDSSPPSGPQVTKQVAQKNLAFVPALLPVQVGTKVEFPNLDDTYHNIFSYSPAKRFDLGRYRPDEKPVPFQIFDQPGLVTLRCDIHEHMRGLILVLTTSHFVVTDERGHYRLTGLPAGPHTLKAWIDSKTTRSKSIQLKDGETSHIDLP
jgi:plastocyanin